MIALDPPTSAGSRDAFDISPRRLRAKKLARRVAVGLGRSLRWTAAPADGSIRVLTYHRFGHSPLDPCCLQPEAFEAQLDWLSANAHVLTPAEFDAVMSGTSIAPPGAVLLTIDDGHGSVAAHALPALDRRGIKAVLFVCPMLVPADDERSPSGDRSSSGHGGFMGWRALGAACATGHAVAPHGNSHRSLGRMPLAEALHDIDAATAALQERLAIRSPFFSFPFGTRADHSPALADALYRRGFRHCFTAAHGRCRPGRGEMLLPRIKIEGGGEQDLFPHIVRGCIDHWRFVDEAMYLLQQRGRM